MTQYKSKDDKQTDTGLMFYFNGLSSLRSAERNSFLRSCMNKTVSRMFPTILFVLGIFFVCSIFILYEGVNTTTEIVNLVTCLYVIALCSIFAVLFRLPSKRSLTMININTLLFWWLSLAGTAVLSYIEMSQKHTTTISTLYLISLAIIPVMNAMQMLPIVTVWLCINVTEGVLCGEPFYYYIFISVTTLLSVYISGVQYINNVSFARERDSLTGEKEELEELASRDPLTGLYNRRALNDRVSKMAKSDLPYAVYMLDIDHFKQYNDMYYHEAGDICLKRIAGALGRCTLSPDDFVARYGGEEFVICIVGIEERDIMSVARNIQKEIHDLHIEFWREQGSYVTVSVGVFYSTASSPEQVQGLRMADRELYNAKGNGRNCISFHGEIYRNQYTDDATDSDVEKAAFGINTKKTVLIVDENSENCETIKNIISPYYDIITSKGTNEAIEKLYNLEVHIDAVILKNQAENSDDYEVLRHISHNQIFRHIPVIVISTEQNFENERECLALGASDYITGPLDPTVVRLRLKNALENIGEGVVQRLRNITEYDELTGIYNRDRFFEATHDILRHGKPGGYVFIRYDIRRFQLVNSFFGNAEGDALLRYMAKCTTKYVRGNMSCTYGRIEMDIFCICMPYENEDSITNFVDHINACLRQYPLRFNICATYGIYIIHDLRMRLQAMLERAGLAAKQAKQKGDTVCLYTDTMREQLANEQEITNEMRSALDGGQFVFYLQPKYDVITEKPNGSEALVRWIHPVKGVILPGKFIPVFEGNGFISELDRHIWRQTCGALRRWIDMGYKPEPISVNMSRVNLYHPDTVKDLCSITDEFGIAHSMLHIEITESAYTDAGAVASKVVSKLREKGFYIIMDDFGSAYSSLNMLKDIDVDMIKLDMRFLSNTKHRERSQSILKCFVNLANSLGVPTVAEGVETEEQASLIRKIGCNFIQGYYYAKPMSVSDYESIYLSDKEKTLQEINNKSVSYLS